MIWNGMIVVQYGKLIAPRWLAWAAAGVLCATLPSCSKPSKSTSDPATSSQNATESLNDSKEDAASADKRTSDEATYSEYKLDDQTRALGIDFQYRNGAEAELFTIIESLGGGVGMLDFELDGKLDLFFPGGGAFVNQSTPGHASGLFWNGRTHFRNVASNARLKPMASYSHGVDVGDFDNDGFPDLLVSGYRVLTLYHNQGDGTFLTYSDWREEANSPLWGTSLAWGDFTGDGNLDAYVACYVNWSFVNNPVCKSAQNGPRDICPPKSFAPLRDLLLISDGQGGFEDAGDRFGLMPDGKGLGVIAADLDNDQDLDLYVANDTTQNFLYINEQGKRFSEVGLRHGVAVDEKGLPNGSMGVAAADYDHNGWFDLWVTNYEREAFALYHNAGDAQFTHFSRRMGTTAIGGAYVGFGTALVDLDSDGNSEIVVANGHVVYHPTAAPYRQKPLLMSLVNGRYQSENFPADAYFGTAHLGRGLAVGDLNGDDALDVVISNVDEPVAVLLNRTKPLQPQLKIRLIGTHSNRDAIGARVVVKQGDEQRSYQITGGGSYMSRSERVISHPLVVAVEKLTVQVYWPNAAEPPQMVDATSDLRELTIRQR